MAHFTCARESLSVRYQWPDTGAEKLDISPTSQTIPISFSRSKRTSALRRETVKMFGLLEKDKTNLSDASVEISRNIIHIKGFNARKKLKNL